MSAKTIVIPTKKVSVVDGKTLFEVWFNMAWHKINRDLINNKKNVLELLATAVFHSDKKTVKKFKQRKDELVAMVTPHLIFLEKENPDDWEHVGNTKKTFKLPPGRYYIGDLCYAMKDEVYDDIWGRKFRNDEGIYKNVHGAHFAMRGTEFGDGTFESDCGKEYLVDSGHIGIAHESLCVPGKEQDNMWTFDKEFSCKFDGETYYFEEGPYIKEKDYDEEDDD